MTLPGYDAWKTTPPDWHMPFHARRYADETSWRMYRNYELTPFFDGDESEYEWLCDEWDVLACIDAHARDPDDDDFEEAEAARSVEDKP